MDRERKAAPNTSKFKRKHEDSISSLARPPRSKMKYTTPEFVDTDEDDSDDDFQRRDLLVPQCEDAKVWNILI